MNRIVLGMHRSGTSLCAGLLHHAGGVLPGELVPADEFNARGYFEPWRLTVFNDECLERRGARWDDVFAPEALPGADRFTPEEGSRAEALTEQFAGTSRLVLKDPRLSLLLPVWRSLVSFRNLEAQHVIMVRHPAAVAASLQRRDRLPRGYALLLWAVYLVSAERSTRGLPRVFVNYQRLLNAPELQLRRMEVELGPEALSAVREFADPGLRHEAEADGLAADDRLRRVIEPLWRWADAAAASTADPGMVPVSLSEGLEAHLRSEASSLRETQALFRRMTEEAARADAAQEALRALSGRSAAQARQQRAEAAALAPELTGMLELSEGMAALAAERDALKRQAAEARYWRRLTEQTAAELEALAAARRPAS